MKLLYKFQRGYTLTEGLSVIALAGFALLVSIPQTLSYLSSYKLKAATQQVTTAIQFTRAKAVSENFQCTYTNLTSGTVNQFQITGGEDDHDDGLNPWEDRNGNGVEDTLNFMPQQLPTGIAILPSLVAVSPVPVTGNPSASATSVTFSPLGVPQLTGSAAAIYLENQNKDRMAVTVDLSGRIQAWKQNGSSWTAM